MKERKYELLDFRMGYVVDNYFVVVLSIRRHKKRGLREISIYRIVHSINLVDNVALYYMKGGRYEIPEGTQSLSQEIQGRYGLRYMQRHGKDTSQVCLIRGFTVANQPQPKSRQRR